jgi:hypothetical protein
MHNRRGLSSRSFAARTRLVSFANVASASEEGSDLRLLVSLESPPPLHSCKSYLTTQSKQSRSIEVINDPEESRPFVAMSTSYITVGDAVFARARPRRSRPRMMGHEGSSVANRARWGQS